VGMVYKEWGAKRKLHSSYRVWETKKNPKQNMLELEEHPKLRNEMVFLLQKMRKKLPNNYQQVLCNPSSKV
jgi:hypothetical protein